MNIVNKVSGKMYLIKKASRFKLVFFSVICALFFLLPGNGYSETFWSFKPRFSASARYDSNFYRAEENEREVYTYLLAERVNENETHVSFN